MEKEKSFEILTVLIIGHRKLNKHMQKNNLSRFCHKEKETWSYLHSNKLSRGTILNWAFGLLGYLWSKLFTIYQTGQSTKGLITLSAKSNKILS